VVSGSVQLEPLHGPLLRLGEGQQVDLRAAGAGQVGAFDVAQLGWRDGVLVAQNQPLGDFLRELGRYRTGLLRWDEALESLRVTGSFRLANTDRILALLSASLPLEVQMRTRYWVTLTLRKNIA
jgi:transmembrane sensor